MTYRYFICDVFSEERFGGNPLAVIPDAVGLSDRQMQQIAHEFNFSETTFVFPPGPSGARRVRIFTPALEVPFAGHPNIGTAFVLANIGALGDFDTTTSVAFDEVAGIVEITIERRNRDLIWCELQAPQKFEVGPSVSAESFAAAVSLRADQIRVATHAPCVASVGLPFVFAELVDRDALRAATPDLVALRRLGEQGVTTDLHLYVRSDDEFDLRTRMFAPLGGVPEDPATGSANCALSGLLAAHRDDPDGTWSHRISQGVEMGRPSILEARARKSNGTVDAAWVGGASVHFSEGQLVVDGENASAANDG